MTSNPAVGDICQRAGMCMLDSFCPRIPECTNRQGNLTDNPDAAQYRAQVRPTLIQRVIGLFAALAWWR